MQRLYLCIFCLFFLVDARPISSAPKILDHLVGSGGQCATCTVLVSLIEQLAYVNEKSVEQIFDEICGYLPTELEPICVYFVNTYAETIIELIEMDFGPDITCQKLQFCTDPTCKLFQKTPFTWKPVVDRRKLYYRSSSVKANPWDWLLALLDRLTQKHEPIVDVDGDLFSTIDTLRGANWRGKDCEDLNKNVHPGAKEAGSPLKDWNCNGIYGVDQNGNSYEETLCGQSEQMGVIVVGDSGGAHFEIPPDYLNASAIDRNTYKNLLSVLENEFDWPMRSGFTGYEPSTPEVPIASIYSYMFNRNRCNHRDYQNVALNGCRSGPMFSDVIRRIARNQTTDYPALVFFELIANDVCFSGPGPLESVAEFKNNVLESMKYLDTILPKGSHVVTVGLLEGGLWWEILSNRTHPIGCTYAEVWEFLSCLHLTPCWVWLNPNETIRDTGSKRAAELSAVYNEIIQNYTFQNFDMVYYDFPLQEIIQIWQQQGGHAWELIEPIDGIHPNQLAHYLTGKWFWDKLSKDHPEFLGPINPNNDLIQQLFGDQQGY